MKIKKTRLLMGMESNKNKHNTHKTHNKMKVDI